MILYINLAKGKTHVLSWQKRPKELDAFTPMYRSFDERAGLLGDVVLRTHFVEGKCTWISFGPFFIPQYVAQLLKHCISFLCRHNSRQLAMSFRMTAGQLFIELDSWKKIKPLNYVPLSLYHFYFSQVKITAWSSFLHLRTPIWENPLVRISCQCNSG